jgi:hypothetical protein
MTHNLKTWPEYFVAVLIGTKTFEIRKNDRDFNVGDELVLQEYEPTNDMYSGRSVKRTVTYVLNGGSFGIDKGYCVLGLRL